MTNKKHIMTSLVKRAGFVVLAATLCIAALSGTAFAYFTANTSASGGHELTLGYESHIEEELDGLDKNITMTNTGETDIMVRVQIFYSNWMNESGDITVDTHNAEGFDGWSPVASSGSEGETWEYKGVLKPGESTSALVAEVSAKSEIKDFDIIVIGQTSPIYYDENGTLVPYLWQAQN